MSDRAVVEGFIDALNAHEVDNALSCMSDRATVAILPLEIDGPASSDGRSFLTQVFTAFPDVIFHVNRLFVTGDGTAAAECNMEGTQAAPFFGIINQEKHVDLDMAWRLVVRDGRIESWQAFWCHNQLLRRLGVKRLDKVTITA